MLKQILEKSQAAEELTEQALDDGLTFQRSPYFTLGLVIFAALALACILVMLKNPACTKPPEQGRLTLIERALK